MTGHMNIGGSWKTLKSAHCNVGGSWKNVKNGYVKVNDKWVQFYTSATPLNFTINLTSKPKQYDITLTLSNLTSWSRGTKAYLRNGLKSYNASSWDGSVSIDSSLSGTYELGTCTVNCSGSTYTPYETRTGYKSAYQGKTNWDNHISSSTLDTAIQASSSVTASSSKSFDFKMQVIFKACGYNTCLFETYMTGIFAKYRYNADTNTTTYLGHTGSIGSDTIYPLSPTTSVTHAWCVDVAANFRGKIIVYPYNSLSNTL